MTMSYTENNATNPDYNAQSNESVSEDSKADAIAIFFLIAIACGAMIFLANGWFCLRAWEWNAGECTLYKIFLKQAQT